MLKKPIQESADRRERLAEAHEAAKVSAFAALIVRNFCTRTAEAGCPVQMKCEVASLVVLDVPPQAPGEAGAPALGPLAAPAPPLLLCRPEPGRVQTTCNVWLHAVFPSEAAKLRPAALQLHARTRQGLGWPMFRPYLSASYSFQRQMVPALALPAGQVPPCT